MIRLKHISKESAELLSQLSIKTFIEAYKDLHLIADLEAYCNENYSIAAMQAVLDQNNTEVVVAFQDSQPAGFYIIKHHQCPYGAAIESTELKQIYVLSSHFGSGLGSQLFNSAVTQAQKNKSQQLWLCVSSTNYRAQAFYNKLGFSKAGDGPQLIVGSEVLTSSILVLNIDSLTGLNTQ